LITGQWSQRRHGEAELCRCGAREASIRRDQVAWQACDQGGVERYSVLFIADQSMKYLGIQARRRKRRGGSGTGLVVSHAGPERYVLGMDNSDMRVTASVSTRHPVSHAVVTG
jgi:hypothetical protein